MSQPSALPDVVRELELHAAQAGWDQPAQLYALVDTAELVRREPALAEAMGVDAEVEGLTPVEQDALPPGQELEDVLQQIEWPAEVSGCAAVVERLVLPPEADAEIPEGRAEAAEYAAAHPDRQEVRIVAAVLREGQGFCALRLRSHDDDDSVLGGPDLVPQLLQLLHATLEEPQEDREEEPR
ncbi:MAG TPA: PPA1309 family protein [Marmoricola sp.]|nr:PPA1309 family protein [Marmoricola sp.]